MRLTKPHVAVTLSVGRNPTEGVTLQAGLTERQQQILSRLQQHMKPAEVADDLGISRNAVYQHITSLKRAGALDDQRRSAALHELGVFDQAADVVARAQDRLTEITEQETQLKEERSQLEAFIKRNRDLVQA